MNEHDKVLDEPQGHLTPVNVPEQIKAIPGVDTHHPEQETVKHAQELQNQGAYIQGPAALLTKVEGQVKLPGEERIEPHRKPGFFPRMFGSKTNSDAEIWESEQKEKVSKREELRHAA